MIVDLMRNDLGRIAELGSVSVPSLLESRSTRTCTSWSRPCGPGSRRPLTALDVVQAAFPPAR